MSLSGVSATNSVAPVARSIVMARRVLQIEAAAIVDLQQRLGEDFQRAVEAILTCSGRVIVCGLGKTGHIGRKVAATLASTGTPAYFVHAAEAVHGDLGMITRHDILVAISNSGETDELLTIVPLFKREGGLLIALCGNQQSSLARQADIYLDASVKEEACSLNLAPTASTTAALALGDALAVSLLDARGFGAADFARSHPGGALGRRLLTHVRDVMRPLAQVPLITEEATIVDVLAASSRGGMGMVLVQDARGRLGGIFTDGDLRRSLQQLGDLRNITVATVMTRTPCSIEPEKLAVEAVQLMEARSITQLPVVDADGVLHGALTMHDLFRAKVV
ncbi:MAG: KpsF/GutQ family sugar-phosphate isomerase [Sterolibacterium sp.]|nr:KpsF/GutQ family sugar-phosphate isomerase [Sterolibacterium sp.]